MGKSTSHEGSHGNSKIIQVDVEKSEDNFPEEHATKPTKSNKLDE